MPQDLTGKTALVTGASKGIGRGIALELAKRGCDVAINYHSDQQGAEDTARQAEAFGRRAIIVGGHVGRSSDVGPMFDKVFAEFQRLHILVNNAGTQVWKPLLELAESEWDSVIETNLKGNFLCAQRAARHMKENGGGRIIEERLAKRRRGFPESRTARSFPAGGPQYRCSGAGRPTSSGCNKFAFPNLVSYTASKGGIEMLTKVAAVELGPRGITVNCVAPGVVEIERTKLEAPDYAGTWAPLTPMRRVGYPSDVATAVCYLAADEAEFVSGQTLFVDGGLFSRGPWAYK